jgi:bifunctional non-homologous end joining protein LigD
VGTGYDDETLDRLGSELRELEQSDSPFDSGDTPSGVHWVEPRVVVEIGFTEWTDQDRLRHPRYLGIRRDKDPADVVRETPS